MSMGGLVLASAVPACGTTSFASPEYELRSIGERSMLRPRFITSVYAFDDQNTVNMYLTDMDASALRRLDDPVNPPSGNIVHVHLFLRPRAGSTPIDNTAVTATVNHAVVAQGEAGIYAGGGFFRPSSEAGARTFVGSIEGGTLRLERSTGRFRDLLGASTLSATTRATLDPAQAEGLRLVMARLTASTRPRGG